MKKYFQSEKRKKRIKKAQLRSLRKKKTKKSKWFKFKGINKENYIKINVPVHFSLVSNYEKTMKFFHKLEEEVKKNNKIKIDMTTTTIVTHDALLYLLSRFDYHVSIRKERGETISILGTVPDDGGCRKYIENSDFFKFVNKRKPNHLSFINQLPNNNIFRTVTGTKTDPLISKECKDFVVEKLRLSHPAEARAIYEILIECMSNTDNHAYSKKDAFPNRWLAAESIEVQNLISFTSLDNGQGIPATVKKKLLDWKITGKTPSDIIIDALKGDDRSGTGQKQRGLGLPKIYSLIKNGKIFDLNIISGRGAVTTDDCTVKPKKASELFNGTLLSWCFKVKSSV